MKERPMIFSQWAIPKLLDGSKTMTRRIIKLQPIEVFYENDQWEAIWNTSMDGKKKGRVYCNDLLAHCRYGRTAGDKPWVRETWRTLGSLDSLAPCELDRECSPIFYEANGLDNASPIFDIGKKRPSIFMPRWASRILLEIVNVRVEKLQDITHEDILAEGWDARTSQPFTDRTAGEDARDWFKNLWDSLYAKCGYRWDTNPWIFSIEFKRI